MGIFSRLHDIIHANINLMLEKAENPEKIIRLVIQEMEDTLVEVRSDAARTIAGKKRLQRQLNLLQGEIDEWQRKAELALSRDREELAHAALKEKHRLEGQAAVLRQELENLDAQLTELNRDIARLQQKLDEAKARHKAMLMKHATVSGLLRTRQQLHDGRLEEALARFESVEQKMERMEGKIEAWDLGHDPALAEQFAELETEDIIDEELSRLKSRLSRKPES